MRRGSIAAIFVALCVLVGLRGGVEVEDQTFIVSMGVDLAEDGRAVKLTLVLPSAKSGGGEEKDTSNGSYEVVSVSAASLKDAFRVLRATIPRHLNFSQLLQVVVSEEAARSAQFIGLLDNILAAPRLKQSALLAVSTAPASEFLKNQTPFLGVRLSATIETSLGVYGNLGNIPVSMLGLARREMRESWRTPLLPLVAVNETKGEAFAMHDNPLDAIAGELPYQGGDPAEYLGAAVISGGRMVGTLTGAQMELLSFIMYTTEEIPFEVNGDYCRLHRLDKTALRAAKENGECALSCELSVTAYPVGNRPVDTDAVERELERALSGLFDHLCWLGSDPVGFEGIAARSVYTLDQWDTAEWQRLYRQAQVKVKVRASTSETM